SRFRPNPSVSFYVLCATAPEVEAYSSRLLEGGKALMSVGTYPWNERYGWVEDRYGVSWQLMVEEQEGRKAPSFLSALTFTREEAGKAGEAMRFYTSVFPFSSVDLISRYEPGDPDKEGTIKHARFQLNGK